MASKTEPPPLQPPAVMPLGRIDLNRVTSLSDEVNAAIEDMFVYKPWSEDQVRDGRVVTHALMQCVRVIIQVVPPGPDRTVALRKLREARMDCNSAITHGGKY